MTLRIPREAGGFVWGVFTLRFHQEQIGKTNGRLISLANVCF
ncbi:hypothetical protein RSAG8_09080, partial [Rhizoctonia solani AG-8 WAC10335]